MSLLSSSCCYVTIHQPQWKLPPPSVSSGCKALSCHSTPMLVYVWWQAMAWAAFGPQFATTPRVFPGSLLKEVKQGKFAINLRLKLIPFRWSIGSLGDMLVPLHLFANVFGHSIPAARNMCFRVIQWWGVPTEWMVTICYNPSPSRGFHHPFKMPTNYGYGPSQCQLQESEHITSQQSFLFFLCVCVWVCVFKCLPKVHGFHVLV